MDTCKGEQLCQKLRDKIRGEAGDPKMTGTLQLTSVDEARHTIILLAVGRRERKGGAFEVFKECPYCHGKLPAYPRVS